MSGVMAFSLKEGDETECRGRCALEIKMPAQHDEESLACRRDAAALMGKKMVRLRTSFYIT